MFRRGLPAPSPFLESFCLCSFIRLLLTHLKQIKTELLSRRPSELRLQARDRAELRDSGNEFQL